MHRIDTTDDGQRWRFRCPECKSSNWRANNGSFGCTNCGTKSSGLLDLRTDEIVSRDEIEFVGPEASWKAPYSASSRGQ